MIDSKSVFREKMLALKNSRGFEHLDFEPYGA